MTSTEENDLHEYTWAQIYKEQEIRQWYMEKSRFLGTITTGMWAVLIMFFLCTATMVVSQVMNVIYIKEFVDKFNLDTLFPK